MLFFRKPEKYFSKHRALPESPQIFDLLQLSKKERDSRNSCLHAINRFEIWKKAAFMVNEPSLAFYVQIEGIILRRQAHEAIRFYRMLRKDRMRIFNEYLEKLPPRSNILQSASY